MTQWREIFTAMRRRPRATLVSLLIMTASAASLVGSSAIQSAERDRALQELGALGADAYFVHPLPSGGQVLPGSDRRASGLPGVHGAMQFQRLKGEARRSPFDKPRIVTPVLAVRGSGRVVGLRTVAGHLMLGDDLPTAAAGKRAAEVLGIQELPQLVSVEGLSVLVTAIVAGDPVLEIMSRSLIIDPGWAEGRFAPTDPRQLLVRSSRTIDDTMLERAANPVSPQELVATQPESVVAARRLAESTAGSIARVLGWTLVGAGLLTTGLTLFSSARTRSHELAVRRIFGASRRHLAGLPTQEGVAIGLLGGVTGSLLGEMTSAVIARSSGALYTLHWQRSAIALGTTLVAATVASVLPAVFAARVDPVDALGVE